MDRRELLGVLGATAAGLAAVTGGSALAQEGHAHKEGDIHEKCADACSDCEKECNQGFHHCYKQVQAGKAGHAKAMHLCVESCEACIAECEKLNDPGMKETVESLRKCAASCREMVKSMGGHDHGRAGATR